MLYRLLAVKGMAIAEDVASQLADNDFCLVPAMPMVWIWLRTKRHWNEVLLRLWSYQKVLVLFIFKKS